jgi:sulfhydrogenase subunit beta (sulfur reductase)
MEALMDDIKGFVLLVPGLQSLIDLLREDGWTVVGPTVRDGVVVHAEIASVDQLPRGVGDLQDGGSYRLRQRGDEAMFGYVGGPQGWKSLLFPAREVLWSGRRVAAEVEIEPGVVDAARLALLGVRSCDLHAIGIHDTVLAKRAVPDTAYVSRRQDNFIVAVTCSDPGGTCFCVSMGTGPVPDKGFDLALTELLDQDGHRFLVVPGSDRGAEVLDQLTTRAAGDEVLKAARADRVAAREVGAADGAVAGHRGAARPAVRERRAPAVGRRGEPLPGLHQLHTRMPHLLLHLRRGR